MDKSARKYVAIPKPYSSIATTNSMSILTGVTISARKWKISSAKKNRMSVTVLMKSKSVCSLFPFCKPPNPTSSL